MTIEQKPLGSISASTIGALFTRDGLKSKTAQSLAYQKAKEIITGKKRDITTVAMAHGVFNEEEAFYNVVKRLFPDSIYQSNQTIEIEKDIYATPDVVDHTEKLVIDIKCPYTPFTFFKNANNLPKGYIMQQQMQMLATGYDKGYVCLYLTSNKIDEWGNKIEYDIPLQDRHILIPIEADKEVQKEIIVRSHEFFTVRNRIKSDLESAIEIDDLEFFNLCKTAKRVTRFQDKSNLLAWQGMIYLCGEEYYVIENS